MILISGFFRRQDPDHSTPLLSSRVRATFITKAANIWPWYYLSPPPTLFHNKATADETNLHIININTMPQTKS